MKRIIDLSYTIESNMPNYSILPVVKIEKIRTIEENGDNVTTIFVPSHGGTHIDAPIHQVDGGLTIDKLSVERFIGDAIMLDVSYKYNSEDIVITLADIEKYKDKVKDGDIVVLNTGCHEHQDEFKKFGYIDSEVASWFVKKNIKLLAVDTPSVDLNVPSGEKMPVHQIILGAGIPIIEGLTNLGNITDERFLFVGFPLKIKDGDGSPCRVVAIEGVK